MWFFVLVDGMASVCVISQSSLYHKETLILNVHVEEFYLRAALFYPISTKLTIILVA